jgi:hypothetical protein
MEESTKGNVISLPPGGTPAPREYDRERTVRLGQFYLKQGFEAFFELGKCLLTLKEFETQETLARLLEEEFGGMALRTAQCYMRFARFAGEFPRFRAVFERPRMLRKGLALLEGLKDPEIEEELQKFEATGELGELNEANLVAKSLRELRQENRRLRRQKDTETEALERANRKLKAQVEVLQVQLAPPDLAGAQKLLHEVENTIIAAGALLRRLPRELLCGDEVLWRLALGVCGTTVNLMQGLERELYEAGPGGGD